MADSADNQKHSVCVLLALFNGAAYIEEQILSVIRQHGVKVFILARDDGSTDGTPELFSSICERNLAEYSLIQDGDRLGPALSFFRLIENAPLNYDYYALCDQDDFWLPGKLNRACKMLNGYAKMPSLYAASLAVVDSDLSILRVRHVSVDTSFGKSLIENNVTGCTAVINNCGVVMLRKLLPPSCIMHDWWMCIFFSCFGNVVLDDKAMLLYRQHGKNCVGMQRDSKLSIRRRWVRHFSAPKRQQLTQAMQFYEMHGRMLQPNERDILVRYIKSADGIFARLSLFFDMRFKRTRVLDSIIWRVLVLFNQH